MWLLANELSTVLRNQSTWKHNYTITGNETHVAIRSKAISLDDSVFCYSVLPSWYITRQIDTYNRLILGLLENWCKKKGERQNNFLSGRQEREVDRRTKPNNLLNVGRYPDVYRELLVDINIRKKPVRLNQHIPVITNNTRRTLLKVTLRLKIPNLIRSKPTE